MIEYIDPFKNKTFVEAIPMSTGVRFIILKERTKVIEFWDIETAKKILNELQQSIESKYVSK